MTTLKLTDAQYSLLQNILDVALTEETLADNITDPISQKELTSLCSGLGLVYDDYEPVESEA